MIILYRQIKEKHREGEIDRRKKMNFKDYPDVYKHVPGWDEANNKSSSSSSKTDSLIRKLIEKTRQQKSESLLLNQKKQEGKSSDKKKSSSSIISPEEKEEILRQLKIEKEVESEKNLQEEEELEALRLHSGGIHDDAKKEFRPRVYRGLWWKWHAIANRYRPKETLRRKQLAPKHSPSGVPGFKRL